ncbi:hypothetical protein ACE7GA_01090 [Roseomonas sp. CCTCC AB2023176]|uniref:hypothetical protein n=1 Tax=Roseomonas sp. CCTCC AB2023176 TaxID=3342640 RepID=UPI0035DE41DC
MTPTQSATGAPGIPWTALASFLPHLVWAGIVVWLLVWIGREPIVSLFGRIQKLGFAGVAIEFKEALEKAAASRGAEVSSVDLGRASRRLARDVKLIQGARLLWIDDNPHNNREEIALFEAAGARVETQTTTEGARENLNRRMPDVILSDIARGEDQKAGLRFADEVAADGKAPPIIFYVGAAAKPLPISAFGLTDRPDELVHLVLDALARHRE